jgi:hypothetical protein
VRKRPPDSPGIFTRPFKIGRYANIYPLPEHDWRRKVSAVFRPGLYAFWNVPASRFRPAGRLWGNVSDDFGGFFFLLSAYGAILRLPSPVRKRPAVGEPAKRGLVKITFGNRGRMDRRRFTLNIRRDVAAILLIFSLKRIYFLKSIIIRLYFIITMFPRFTPKALSRFKLEKKNYLEIL